MATELFEILKISQSFSDDTLQLVEDYAERWSCSGMKALLETNTIMESELADLLAQQLKIDRVYSFVEEELSSDLSQALSYSDAWAFECFPTKGINPDQPTVEVAFADPTDGEMISKLKNIMGCDLKIVVAERTDILNAIQSFYPIESRISSLRGPDA